MNPKDKRMTFSIVIYALLLALTVALVAKIGSVSEKTKERVGFITTGSVEDFGWNTMTYQGVSTACQELGMELLTRDQVATFDGSCPQAVQELVAQDASIIILNNGDYAEEMKDLLEDYPNVMFYCASAGYEADNLTKYFARMYQARYLSGIVAGMATRTDKVGYVAAVVSAEIYRNVNAFAMGVRRVNPDAEIAMVLVGRWDDQEKEIAAAERLIAEGADVLTYQTNNQPYVIDVAEAAGIASIGYYQVSENASDLQLTCVECNWAPLFENLLQDYQRGMTGGNTDWLGMESGVSRLTEFSPLVSQKAKDEVQKAANEILAGQDVFTNVIYDNQGKLRCGEGEAIGDQTLLYGMDWLAEGVKVYE